MRQMASWNNAVVTEKGLALKAKLHGGGEFRITKVLSGAGKVAPKDLAKQRTVSEPKQELIQQEPKIHEDGSTTIPVLLTNSGVEVGYICHQIGFYAIDPDEGEILYCIAQDEDGDKVENEVESPGQSIEWEFNFNVGNASKVAVTIDMAGHVTYSGADARYVTKEKLDEHVDDESIHVTESERNAWNGKADLVDGKVPGEQLPEDIEEHLLDTVSDEDGVHGIRVNDNTLQYKSSSGKWESIEAKTTYQYYFSTTLRDQNTEWNKRPTSGYDYLFTDDKAANQIVWNTFVEDLKTNDFFNTYKDAGIADVYETIEIYMAPGAYVIPNMLLDFSVNTNIRNLLSAKIVFIGGQTWLEPKTILPMTFIYSNNGPCLSGTDIAGLSTVSHNFSLQFSGINLQVLQYNTIDTMPNGGNLVLKNSAYHIRATACSAAGIYLFNSYVFFDKTKIKSIVAENSRLAGIMQIDCSDASIPTFRFTNCQIELASKNTSLIPVGGGYGFISIVRSSGSPSIYNCGFFDCTITANTYGMNTTNWGVLIYTEVQIQNQGGICFERTAIGGSSSTGLKYLVYSNSNTSSSIKYTGDRRAQYYTTFEQYTHVQRDDTNTIYSNNTVIGLDKVFGTYTGDGTASRQIDLGFKPRIVILFPADTSSYGRTIAFKDSNGSLSLSAYNTTYAYMPTFKGYPVNDTGFLISTSDGYSTNYNTNYNGAKYTYIALR